jgi:hypothetical protein
MASGPAHLRATHAVTATPLYKRLEAAGWLTRPRHWKDFVPFTMAHTLLKMTIEEAHAELNYGPLFSQ